MTDVSGSLASPGAASSDAPPTRLASDEGLGESAKAKTPLSHLLLGKPRDPHDHRLFHKLSLIPFLAWIGLGADGLSSSAYGPEEAFRTLGEHTYLAVPLACLMVMTIAVISACYSRIIEVFPHGGGGYLVAMKILGERAGIVAGAALLVDYVLTITVSVAAAWDALFSLSGQLGLHAADHSVLKVILEVATICFLVLINLRGVRESILLLVPVFVTFIITHAVIITAGFVLHAGEVGAVSSRVSSGFKTDLLTSGLGIVGMMRLFFQAYALGGGTYTGIEAVSNGLALMRAPQVMTGKRTMLYMAISLSFMASGLLLCYLLLGLQPVSGQTFNAVLSRDVLDRIFGGSPRLATALLLITLVSEGALLIVAAQAGFIAGPRVMANMAIDSLLPRRFAALSDRFTTSNGIVIMAVASLAALLYTHGDVRSLVLMYSINVFVTFSLAQLGMVVYWWRERGKNPVWRRRLTLFTTGFIFCSMILCITVFEKFTQGGWITLAVTSSLVALCLIVKRHYRSIGRKIEKAHKLLESAREEGASVPEFDPRLPTAVLLVSGFGALGLHTILKALQVFPGYFKNLHFISVGTIDIGNFKGSTELEALEKNTQAQLQKYVDFAHGLGIPARYSYAMGTDTIDVLEALCRTANIEYQKPVFFCGKLIFERERWYHSLFHNMTAYTIQRRLSWQGILTVILPLRVFEQD